MKKTNKLAAAAVSAAIAVLCVGNASAGPTNPSANTANLEFGEVLKIRLPYGLCEFEKAVPAYVVDQLSARRDWNELVTYMLANCPDLGLPLADTATASISDPVDDGSDGGAGGGGGTGGDTGGDTVGDTGSDDDDGNNGHGNDADGHDESNPGKS